MTPQRSGIARRIRRPLVVVLMLAFAGCSYVGSGMNAAAIAFGLLRAPFVIPTSPPNDKLPVVDRVGLDTLAADTQHRRDRYPIDPQGAGLPATLDPLTYDASAKSVQPPADAFDNLCDLGEDRRQAVVFIAFSGGGARAAVLAAKTMVLLERRYNELTRDIADAGSFAQAVDAYSSVSGGSLYTYHLALQLVGQRAEGAYERSAQGQLPASPGGACPTAHSRDQHDAEPVASLAGDTAARHEAGTVDTRYASSLSSMGFESAAMYFNIVPPWMFFYGPLSTLFTDNSYLQFMATSLQYHTADDLWSQDLTRPEGWRRVFGPLDQTQVTLGMIGDRPRFFFNATSLETGGPFVMTQRMMHLPSDHFAGASARADVMRNGDRRRRTSERFQRPLRHAITLEEINSSPATFPLATAAMASAAFPLAMDPLPVRRFGYDAADRTIYETDRQLHLADGGVWDNSGLLTLTDLAEHINSTRPGAESAPLDAGHRMRVILVSVNAETETYDPPRLLAHSGDEHDWLDTVGDAAPIIPLRVESIYPSIDLIHYTNKRRGEQMAIESVADLKQGDAAMMERALSPTLAPQIANALAVKHIPPEKVLDDLLSQETPQLFYFPVWLTQLSSADAVQLGPYDDLFERVQKIGTNYTVDSGDPRILEKAAEVIVGQRQGRCRGWFVGPAHRNRPTEMTEVQRLDEALALAILRTNKGLWPDNGEVDRLTELPAFTNWESDAPTEEDCRSNDAS